MVDIWNDPSVWAYLANPELGNVPEARRDMLKLLPDRFAVERPDDPRVNERLRLPEL